MTDREPPRRRFPFAVAGIVLALLVGGALIATRRGEVDPCLSTPKSHERVRCHRSRILEIARQESPKRAIEVAYELQTSGVIGECHLLAHAVGEELYARTPEDIPGAFASCSDKCVQGCYHGFMSRLLPARVGKDRLASTIGSLCDGVRADPITHKQCVHGIGHGLLTHGYLDRREAIGMCRTLAHPLETNACLDGVFMENMFPYLALDEANVVARLPDACADVIAGGDAELVARCLFEVADGLMFYTDYDLERALRMCEGLNDSNPIDICRASARQWKSIQEAQAVQSRTGR